MSSLLPILIRPKVKSVLNRWIKGSQGERLVGRDLVMLTISILVIYSLFEACIGGLLFLKRNKIDEVISPSILFGISFNCLSILLLLSSAVTALTALFISEDLELILASSLSTNRFFLNKFSEILLSSAWMIVLFGAPSLFALYLVYAPNIHFFLLGTLALVPLIAIPTCLAMIAIPLLCSRVSATASRMALPLVLILFATTIYIFTATLAPRTGSLKSQELIEVVHRLQSVNVSWSPATWSADIIGKLLVNDTSQLAAPFFALYAMLALFMFGSYLTMKQLYFTAYSKSKALPSNLRLNSRSSQRMVNRLTLFLNLPTRALMVKEMKVFARDMTQIFQLMLLMVLCMIYLYNFKLVEVIRGASPFVLMLWQALLVISNIAMGAFIIIALSTRFVFPSISMEGNAYWILQSAPISTCDVLRAKFWSWLPLVSLISTVVLCSGALAVQADLEFIFVTFLCSLITSYGIVGLAVGFGALFSNFDWEHSSQLSASVGSLVYMLCSTIFVLITLLPTAFVVFLTKMGSDAAGLSRLEWRLALAVAMLLIIQLNRVATKWALEAGKNHIDSLARGDSRPLLSKQAIS